MKYLCLTLVLALSLPPSFGYDCRDTPVLTTTKRDGTKVGLVISQAQIDASPAWDPTDGEPPLAVSKAHTLVMEWAKTAYSRYDSVSVREISLSTFGCSSVRDKWYYRFDLTPIFDGNELWGSGNWAAVLMDGTVIGTQELE